VEVDVEARARQWWMWWWSDGGGSLGTLFLFISKMFVVHHLRHTTIFFIIQKCLLCVGVKTFPEEGPTTTKTEMQ
jgi:hypothetical protein